MAILLVAGCYSTPRHGTSPDPQRLVLSQGDQLLAGGDIDAAEAAFQSVVSPVHPPSIQGEASLGLARCELARRRPDLAIRHVQRAEALLENGEFRVAAGLLLAEAYLMGNQFSLVKVHLERVFPYLAEGPERQRSAMLLALIHERDGDDAGARRYWSFVRRRDTAEVAAWREHIAPPPPEIVMPPRPRPRETRTTAPPPRKRTAPAIVGRKSWGARNTRRNVRAMGRATRITIHHTGEENLDASTRSECVAYLKRLQSHSQGNRGMADVPYHYLIDERGNIYEGRPMRYQGAHAGSPKANANNIGIALIGNFESGRPQRQQLDSLASFVITLRERHGIPASRVYGHGELKRIEGLPYTDCPGRFLKRVLKSVLSGPHSCPPAPTEDDRIRPVSHEILECGHRH